MDMRRFIGMGALFVLVSSCSGPAELPGAQSVSSALTASGRHKVQVEAAQAGRVAQHGGTLIADYGSYQLLEVDGAGLASVAGTPSLELRDEYNLIRLNAGAIDTASAHGASLRGMALPASGRRLYLVQFAGPIQPEWYAGLQATGVRIVTYIPNNTYLVYGDAAALGRVQAFAAGNKAVQWDGAYLDDYKLDPTVGTAEVSAYSIQLVKDEEANAATLAAIDRVKTRGAAVQEALGYVDVLAPLSRRDAVQLALEPDVVSIQPHAEPQMRDERQDMIVSGNIAGSNPAGPGYLAWLASKGFTQAQFTASGFGVDVTDSGVDNGTTSPNHFALYVNGDVLGASRLAYSRLEGTPNVGSTLQGCDGHGNLSAHIIGGYASQAGAPHVDATGYQYGLGVAPFVRLGSSVIFDPGTYTTPNFENLQSEAYNDGMRISSNAWGGGAAGAYTSESQRYDALVRDAQPVGSTFATAGNQEMSIVFVVGNSGPGATSVGYPGTAKNVITVGASENVRAFAAPDRCGITDTSADNPYDVTNASSRGPTADGRKKPDLLAPGTHVTGGVAQAPGQRANPPGNPLGLANTCFNATSVCGGTGTNLYFPASQQWYTASSGSSNAASAVSGAAALVRQYFLNQGQPAPSPAMTKAYLMSSARYMTGSGANDSLYSNNQGMGLVDLGMAFDGVPRMLRDQLAADLFTATGQTRTFTGFVADTTKPFRVTLAWTDAPGSTTGSAWRNNLDLTVTVGANTYLGNVFTGANSVTGGTADLSNNVESVFLPAGASGAFTVTVAATNINSDGVPGNASPLDQDFALVMDNACATAPATPTGLAVTVGGSNRLDLSWSGNGGTSFYVYRSNVSGGPYTRVGTTAATTYSDTTVSGGVTYYYVVRSVACAESANSNQASATATGACTLPPVFAGLASAANNSTATCATALVWSAAAASCGGILRYSVYRSTTSGFTPSVANRIASGVATTSFTDNLALTSGTTYYYVVHAVETGAATVEETNLWERSVTPTGPPSTVLNYFDDLDANRPPNAAAYWIPTNVAGGLSLGIASSCRYQSALNAWKFGAATCPGTYGNSVTNVLYLGGNGSTAGVNGFAIPTGATGTMTFRISYDLEATFDGAQLWYSTTGAAGTYSVVPDVVTAGSPYITTGGYDTVVTTSSMGRAWSTTNLLPNGGFRAVSVNLDALAGSTVWFAFGFVTDASVTREGFYLDDVRVTVSGASSCTTSTPPPGPAAAYRITGLPATVVAGATTSLTLTAVDAFGQTSTSYSGTASFTSTDTGATLPPNTPLVNGVAAGIPVTLRTAGPQTLTASDTVTPGITGRGSTTVTVGPAVALAFQTQPSATVAGVAISPSVQVRVTDAGGNLINTSSATITVNLGNNPGGSTLSGTTTVTAVNGVATFPGLSLNKIGTGYTLTASSAGLSGATSAAFNITPAAPASLAVTGQPTNTVAGAPITPAVQVAIRDAFGNLTTSTANVTLAIGANPSGGVLSGTTTVAAVAGVASFANLSIDKPGLGYTLVAGSAGLPSVTSAAFNIVPSGPTHLSFSVQPSNAAAGVAIAPAIQVTVLDAFGNVATSPAVSVTLSFGNNPSGANLLGTSTVTSVNGVATFSTLAVDKVGTAYTLVAGAAGLLGATSVGFNVTAGAATQLAFTTQPTDATAGVTLAPALAVTVRDAYGNTVTGSTTTVTMAFGNNPGGGTLAGTTSAAPVAGVASFSTLSINRTGTGYTLTASAPGLTSATSSAFNINPGAPSALAFQVQPTATLAGANLSPAVVVAVKDSLGNTVTSSTASVALGLGTNPSGATLGGTSTVNAVAGVATFSTLSVNRPGTGYTLTAASPGLTGATSTAFDVSVGAPVQLGFVVQPSNAVAGANLAPAVQVAVQDALGNTVTSVIGNVTVALSGSAGGSLSGSLSAAFVSGVASFANLSVNRAGTGYTLTASAPGLTSATSAPFAITAGPAAQLAFTVQPGLTQAGAAITPAVQVAVVDSFGNPVPSASATVTVALGTNPSGATLAGTLTATTVAGVASFANLSLARSGTGYTLLASAPGLGTATSAGFDITVGPPTRLVFTTHPVNTAAGATMATVAVTMQDPLGNTIPSNADVTVSFGNNPSAANLGGGRTVAAVNGVARFTSLTISRAGIGYTLVANSPGYATGTSASFDVGAGPAAVYVLTGLAASVTAGQEATFSVAVQDAYGNPATDYLGSAAVTSSDANAILPAVQTFTNGVLSGVKVTFRTVGLQSVTVTDRNNSALTVTGQSNVSPFPPPTVSVTAPANGAVVTGKVTLTATGSVAPGTSLAQLALLVDGTVVGTDTHSPASVTWDSDKVPNNTNHSVTAVVSDAAGNVVTSLPVTVTVKRACGCGATGGVDASSALALAALGRALLAWRKRRRQGR